MDERVVQQPVAEQPVRRRLDYLDGLRVIAAVTITAFHATRFVPEAITPDMWVFHAGFPLFKGYIAVPIFFVLSGCCLALPTVRHQGHLAGGMARFYLRRAWRILPPFFAALALSYLFILLWFHHTTYTIWDAALPVSWQSPVADLLMMQDIWQRMKGNPALWSLATEWRLYLLFPLLLWLLRELGVWRFLLITAVIGYTVNLLVQGSCLAGSAPYLFVLFCLGMATAYIITANTPGMIAVRRVLAAPWLLLMLAACFLLVGYRIPTDAPMIWGVTFSTLCAACSAGAIIYCATHEQARLNRMLSSHVMRSASGWSYSLFLFHMPVLCLVRFGLFPQSTGNPIFDLVRLMLVGVPLALLVAYVMSLLIEQPIRRWLEGGKQPRASKINLESAWPAGKVPNPS